MTYTVSYADGALCEFERFGDALEFAGMHRPARIFGTLADDVFGGLSEEQAERLAEQQEAK